MEPAWIAAYVVVVVIALFFIVMYFRASVLLVNPNQCGASYGLYSVTPGQSGQILNQCGDNGNTACTFVVDTLLLATTQCDDDSGVCSAFQYSAISRQMSYISPTAPTTAANTTDIYRRNVSPIHIGSTVTT